MALERNIFCRSFTSQWLVIVQFCCLFTTEHEIDIELLIFVALIHWCLFVL